MTAATEAMTPRIEPMPARKRYGIATASSVGFHLIVLLLVGMLGARAPVQPDILIPIELTMFGQAGERIELGGGGHPKAAPKETSHPSTAPEPTKEQPSSKGAAAKAAPAPPKILTSKKGTEPAGPVGVAKAAAGLGGKEDKPAGPTKGPGVLGGTPPIYPKDALDRGLEGKVSLSVAVAEDGSVSSVSVAESSGHEMLDAAAVRAVKRDWRFQPGLKEGKPATGSVTVTFEFTSGKVESR